MADGDGGNWDWVVPGGRSGGGIVGGQDHGAGCGPWERVVAPTSPPRRRRVLASVMVTAMLLVVGLVAAVAVVVGGADDSGREEDAGTDHVATADDTTRSTTDTTAPATTTTEPPPPWQVAAGTNGRFTVTLPPEWIYLPLDGDTNTSDIDDDRAEADQIAASFTPG